MKTAAIAGVTGALLASVMVVASETTPITSLFKLKSGVCKFTILDSTGVKPLDGQKLTLSSVEDGKELLSAISDRQGVCSLTVAPGRYILSVNATDLAVLESSPSEKLAECRIVLPSEAMPVGGAEAASGASEGGQQVESARRLAWLGAGGKGAKALLIGGAVILAGGGGYLIYENNNEEDEEEEVAAPVEVPTKPRRVSK